MQPIQMRKSPVTVQQWVDTLPSPGPTSSSKKDEVPARPTSRTFYSAAQFNRMLTRDFSMQSDDSERTCKGRNNRKYFTRDMSFQSDDGGSHCSSVESVLDSRRPDPEAVLLGLGFGPARSSSLATRIPARFLQPSKVLTRIDINKFLEEYDPNPQQQYSFYSSTPGSPAKKTS